MLMNAFLRFPSQQQGETVEAILHNHLFPSTLQTDGITISCMGNYPFAPAAVLYWICTSKPFDLFIRIPGWATGASTIEHADAEDWPSRHREPFVQNVNDSDTLTGLHKIRIPATPNYRIALTLEAQIRVEKHADKSVSIFYGPLLYADFIQYRHEYKEPRNYKDQASTCPEMLDTSREIFANEPHDEFLHPLWNWGIAIDPNQEMKAIFKQPWVDDNTKKDFHELPNPIWKPGAPPVSIEVTAVCVDWPVQNGTAAPPSAVDTSESGLRRKPFRLKLQPFGAAKLHMAQFPTADLPEPV